MSRESAQLKGARYLIEHRVNVIAATTTSFTATVCGSGATHLVRCIAGSWGCDCPAKGPCSHLHACQAIFSPRTS